MAIELKDIKQYLRISHDIDDDYIKELVEMSKQLIEEQTGVIYSESDKVYEMTIKQVVAHFYDKRESFSEKSAVEVPYTMDSLIKHIGMRGAKNE